MNNFISLNYWFNLRPAMLLPFYQKSLTVMVIALVILTVVFAVIQTRNKKNLYGRFWSRLYYFNLANAIVGAVLLFFSYEMLPLLSARFWFLVWGLEIAVWLGFLIKTLTAIPKRKQQLEQENEYRKYLP